MTLLAEGSVTFEGRYFVKQHGVVHKRIAPSCLAPIFKKIEEINFWDLENSYYSKKNPDGSVELVTDYPTQYVTVKCQAKTKRIQDYYGAPKGLSQLESLIDDVAGVAEWIGTQDEKTP